VLLVELQMKLIVQSWFVVLQDAPAPAWTQCPPRQASGYAQMDVLGVHASPSTASGSQVLPGPQ
jgi:hypothetical protein